MVAGVHLWPARGPGVGAGAGARASLVDNLAQRVASPRRPGVARKERPGPARVGPHPLRRGGFVHCRPRAAARPEVYRPASGRRAVSLWPTSCPFRSTQRAGAYTRTRMCSTDRHRLRFPQEFRWQAHGLRDKIRKEDAVLFSDNQDGWQRQSGWMTPGWAGGWV